MYQRKHKELFAFLLLNIPEGLEAHAVKKMYSTETFVHRCSSN